GQKNLKRSRRDLRRQRHRLDTLPRQVRKLPANVTLQIAARLRSPKTIAELAQKIRQRRPQRSNLIWSHPRPSQTEVPFPREVHHLHKNESRCAVVLAVDVLRTRRNGRAALEMVGEYDVRYLLHAILRLDFDDVRPEEWSPSYAGSASRMDF